MKIDSFDAALDTFTSRLQSRGKSDGTIRKYTSNVRQFRSFCNDNGFDVEDIDQWVIEDYFAQMHRDEYAPKTIQSHHTSIRLMIDVVLERDPEALGSDGANPAAEFVEKDDSKSIAGHNGTLKEQENREIPYVEPAEKEAMCEQVNDPKIRNEVLIRLLWQTGIRSVELINIKLRDINHDRCAIDIYSEKTNTTRTVFYQPNLKPLMNRWLNEYRAAMLHSDSEYLFISKKADQFNPKTPRRIVKDAAENADVQYELYENSNTGNTHYGITTHSMRHGHAVQSIKNGIDIETLRRHLGHSQLEQTKTYLDLVDTDIERAYRDVGPGYESR